MLYPLSYEGRIDDSSAADSPFWPGQGGRYSAAMSAGGAVGIHAGPAVSIRAGLIDRHGVIARLES